MLVRETEVCELIRVIRALKARLDKAAQAS
jgi:hypothetical protein